MKKFKKDSLGDDSFRVIKSKGFYVVLFLSKMNYDNYVHFYVFDNLTLNGRTKTKNGYIFL